MKKLFLSMASLLLVSCSSHDIPGNDLIRAYVAAFNEADSETYANTIPNAEAAQFLADNIPVFECPDKELERTYYFRWWTYRKHVRKTDSGYVITEFLPDVRWAGKYNTISCAASHHTYEGRWLRNGIYLSDYLRFWMTPDASPRSYSFPAADAVWNFYQVHPDRQLIRDLYPLLEKNLKAWNDHLDENGLYWQTDNRDGMEESVSGKLSADCSGYRVTINSYAYADAKALGRIAAELGLQEEATAWRQRASEMMNRMNEALWDADAGFYKVLPKGADRLSDARELHGYVPWMYSIPDESKGGAWSLLFDTLGFAAPFGPTTVERKHPGFSLTREGHDCKWNGPSWPFATSQTLMGMADCLRRFGERFFTKEQYLDQLITYSNSHRMGNRCFIDENLDPFTGEWLARSILMSRGNVIPDRGKDYNHSTFADLIISGLLGIQTSKDGRIEVNPLLPEGKWNYWCLVGIPCADKLWTVIYDKTGRYYGKGKGIIIEEYKAPANAAQ
ncbi:MAG: trehalase family glycosidase [Bacteroidales bacterium]|nr:trehalase family glycosidase [Bacteroidales bacterium]